MPAVCRDPDGVAVPEAAASLNWVFLRDSDDFAEGVATLTRALETDLDHVRTHTRLGVAAGRWEASGRDASQILRGAELTAAENWLVSAGEKQPPPTSGHREYGSSTLARRSSRSQPPVAGRVLTVYPCELCGGRAQLLAVARRHLTRGFTADERATDLSQHWRGPGRCPAGARPAGGS